MQTVNVTELQTNLIAWLERVRAGEEVLDLLPNPP